MNNNPTHSTLIDSFKKEFDESSDTFKRIVTVLDNHFNPVGITTPYKDLTDLYSAFRDCFGIDFYKIGIGNRVRKRVYIRQYFFYQCREIFGHLYTLTQVAEFLRYDHTTVIHSVRNVRDKLLIGDSFLVPVNKKWEEFYNNQLSDINPLNIN